MPHRSLRSPHPVDLPLVLGPLRVGTHDPCIRLSRREAWRATRTSAGPVTLHLTDLGDTVEAEAWGPGADEALDLLPDLLGHHDDPDAFVTDHPFLRGVQRRTPGLRIGRTRNNVVEVLVPTILGQKVTGLEQKRAWSALARRHGEPAPGPDVGLRVPPTAATLAALPYYAFHPLGVERKRADAIRRVAERAPRVEETLTMSYADACRRLEAFPGVGPWTSAIVTRVTMGDPDAVEVGDYNLPSLVAWNLAGEPRGDDARMLELLEPFRGQRARVCRLLAVGGERPPRYGPRLSPRSFAAM